MECSRKQWMVLPFIAMFFIHQVHADWDWMYDPTGNSQQQSSYPIRSERACEEYPLSLRCPGSDVIQIVTAEYGRQNTVTCSALPSQMKNTNCALPEAFDIMSSKCNNKTECSLKVSSAIFRDPCPGTHKYLSTMFNCVKYMFGCPGFLIGIGTEEVSAVALQPQEGTWVKDPLYNTEHVFFAPFNARQAQTLHEYLDWEDFIAGNLADSHNLPYNVAPGNLVVYDRNLYYVKANSRRIVKYSFITRKRVKESIIPKPRSVARGAEVGADITIVADENGLWVTYNSQSRGTMAISKLDKDDLTILKTWTTSYNQRDALHTFIICGVVYVVSSNSGTVGYSYNTNVETDNEKRGHHLTFDADRTPGFGYLSSRGSSSQSRRRFGPRSFLRYNASSMSYNPRDRLLYLWDETGANAVFYKLHFDEQDPAKANIRTTASTTTTTTRRTTTKTTRPPTPPELPPPDEEDIYVPALSPIDYCAPTVRGNLNWPKTMTGEVAKLACPDNTGAVATWSCVRDSSMREAAWHVAGPDMSKCITWASDIEKNFDSRLIDAAEACEQLESNMERQELTDKAIEITSELVKKLVDQPSSVSKFEAERIVKSLTAVSSNLLNKENTEAWKSMGDIKRAAVANTLMTAVEKAGFLYADVVAAIPAEARSKEPLVVAPKDILMQVEVRDRSLSASSQSVMTFPSDKTCPEDSEWSKVSDVIEIPNSAIMSQNGEGPATVVFALYRNLGQFLASPPASADTQIAAESEDDDSPRNEWEINSRVISASFRDSSYEAQLDKPAVITLHHKETSSHPHRCVYWDYSESSGTGNWSDVGCRKIGGNSTQTRCECDHLTSFAVLVNHAGVTAEEVYHEKALDIVTSVGISISIVCLVLCLITFSCFRNLRSDRNTIHKHLCICLLVAETIFLIGINQTQHKIACAVIAGVLHYFFLAAFLWMALEGFQLYVMLVEVFEDHSRWKWYYLTGYGIPAVIVGVSAGVDHTGYGTDEVCWLRVDSGFIWSFVGPVCVVILANLVFLAITVYKMYVHTMTFSDTAKINSIKASVRGASVLLCLLGITWAFGILWISEHMTVLAYLFCVFNAFQGMFIFIFHCLLPRKVRQEYSRCFNRFPCCETIPRDTYVSNSMSFSKQYTPGRYANGTGGGTQQASLSRQSQLRRMWNETVGHGPKNSDTSPISSEVTNIAQNRDTSRSGTCTHRVTTQPPNNNTQNDQQIQAQHDPNAAPLLPARQQQLRQEDDVFYPTEVAPEKRQTQAVHVEPEDTALLPSEHTDDVQYDCLQHHHHPVHYHHPPPFDPDNYPPGHFQHNTGQLPPFSRQHYSSTVAHPHDLHDHPHATHFNPGSYSQSRIHDILDDPNMDPRFNERRFDGGRMPAPYWSDSPLGHQYQSSFEENVSNAKRDSGISMQHPPNSMINQLASEMQRNKGRRSNDNLGDGMQQDSDGSNRINPSSSKRYPHPIRNIDRAEEDCHPSYTPQRRSQRHEGFPEGENQPPYEGREKDPKCKKSNTMTSRLGPHCPNHHPMLVPLSERHGKSVTMANRRRKSLSSDSDDPIVTDCSVSSTGSSFGNPVTSLSRVHNRQDNISEEPYYEEPTYHKRRLPDPNQSMQNHREQWYPNKNDAKRGSSTDHDQHEDENDLEVEMITAPEGAVESPRPASSYHIQQGSSTSPNLGHNSEDSHGEERFISPPAGYRSGAGGKIYAPPGSTVDKHRQSNREHMAYYNRNSGHSNSENRSSPVSPDYGKSPYRYLHNNLSREGSVANSRNEDMDANGGLRMMTNL